jgi:hypothetical protein
MSARPVFTLADSVSDPKLAQAMRDSAARAWVWVNPEGAAFWLHGDKARFDKLQANRGGTIFPPEAP